MIAYTRFPFHRTHWEYLHWDEFMGFFDSSTQGFNFQIEILTTLLGDPSFVRFCQQEFGMFHHPAWAVGSYSSGPPAGGTPQILVDKTSRMTGRLRVYSSYTS